ncbi:hypothetical protein HBI42_188840 [Parastagonospora nodorum]|nr:hypothetical protein HBI42_188840 [Parastagonospora nodorum]
MEYPNVKTQSSGTAVIRNIFGRFNRSFTYDHRTMRTRLPVRSAIYKHRTGGLVVRWVTTGESPLLYVFAGVGAFLNMILAYI